MEKKDKVNAGIQIETEHTACLTVTIFHFYNYVFIMCCSSGKYLFLKKRGTVPPEGGKVLQEASGEAEQ